ncbi:hypothetical protein [Streptomyces sp. SA15]|uniref:hypothetical protein n=1 Tax=Streptomyces sp. SA15 TaxID=934019 RepID=UPI0015CC0E21|nr:hypothetical protein [Streptomyces sp. SA15]
MKQPPSSQSNGTKEKYAADAVIRDDDEKPDDTPYTEGDAAGLTQGSGSPSTASSRKS